MFRCILFQGCLRVTVTYGKTPTTVTWSGPLQNCCQCHCSSRRATEKRQSREATADSRRMISQKVQKPLEYYCFGRWGLHDEGFTQSIDRGIGTMLLLCNKDQLSNNPLATCLCRQRSGHEWTANSSLHVTRTVNCAVWVSYRQINCHWKNYISESALSCWPHVFYEFFVLNPTFQEWQLPVLLPPAEAHAPNIVTTLNWVLPRKTLQSINWFLRSARQLVSTFQAKGILQGEGKTQRYSTGFLSLVLRGTWSINILACGDFEDELL